VLDRHGKVTSWSLIVGLSLLVVACSGSDDSAGSGSGEGGLRDGAFDEVEGMEVRADQVPISSEDEIVILLAEQRLIAACMTEEGFQYDTEVDLATRYTVPSAPLFLPPNELRRSGYQYDWDAAAESFLEANPPGGVPPSATDGMTPEEAAAFSEALRGDGDHFVELEDVDGGTTGMSVEGCEGEARLELYGSVENAMRFYRAAETVSASGLSRKLREQAPYRAPLETWQECMREAGHDVAEATDYGLSYLGSRHMDALSQGHGNPLTEAEIESVADADADCQESSGLFEVREELLPEAMDEIAAELGFEMSQYVAFQHAVLERAEQVP
jgi:hypothetical protein